MSMGVPVRTSVLFLVTFPRDFILGREQWTVPVFIFDFDDASLVLLDRFHQVGDDSEQCLSIMPAP